MTTAQPEVLNEREAAAYCRLSVTSFRKAVKAGKLPSPPPLAVRRRIWHVEALRVALGAGSKGAVPTDDWESRKASWRQRRESRREDRPRNPR